jgi:hypothetical protein
MLCCFPKSDIEAHGMDTWPPTSRKGKTKASYPLLEGGALTSATLRERNGRLEWVTAQNLSPGVRNATPF